MSRATLLIGAAIAGVGLAAASWLYSTRSVSGNIDGDSTNTTDQPTTSNVPTKDEHDDTSSHPSVKSSPSIHAPVSAAANPSTSSQSERIADGPSHTVTATPNQSGTERHVLNGTATLPIVGPSHTAAVSTNTQPRSTLDRASTIPSRSFIASSQSDSPWNSKDLHPLAAFFDRFNLHRPELVTLKPHDIPPPFGALLRQSRNTTFMLREFWSEQKVNLRVIAKQELRAEGVLERWIVLEVEKNQRTQGWEEKQRNRTATSSNAAATPSSPAAVAPILSPSGKRRPSSYVSAARSGAGLIPNHARSSSAVLPSTNPSTPARPKPGRMRFQESLKQATASPADSPRATSDSTDDAFPALPSSSSSTTAPTPVEFASIRIHVNNLPPTLHEDVWAGKVPLATLLAQHNPPIQQTCHPTSFFRLEWNEALARVLGLSARFFETTHVYGRCNALRDDRNQVICDVVEIMPPILAP